MTLVSKYKPSEKIGKRIEEIFVWTISNLKDESASFLDEFLSPTEKIVLSKRLAIAVMLSKGFGYEEIKETLKVTSATVAKVSYWMKYKGKGFLKIVDMIKRDEKHKEFWKDLDYFVANVLTYHKGLYGIGERDRINAEREREKSFIL